MRGWYCALFLSGRIDIGRKFQDRGVVMRGVPNNQHLAIQTVHRTPRNGWEVWLAGIGKIDDSKETVR